MTADVANAGGSFPTEAALLDQPDEEVLEVHAGGERTAGSGDRHHARVLVVGDGAGRVEHLVRAGHGDGVEPLRTRHLDSDEIAVAPELQDLVVAGHVGDLQDSRMRVGQDVSPAI